MALDLIFPETNIFLGQKKMEFSNRLNSFGDEIFAALNDRRIELQSEGKKIYNLSVGTPDFKTPEHIMKALSEAAMDPDNWKYALRDTDEMLEAVCNYYDSRFGVKITPDMVCSCNGSQEGMGHIGMALCNAGDTVLLPTPCYPVFIAGAKMAEADIYYYEMKKENDFLPDVDSIPDDIAKKAKYMIVSLPSNPMGSVGTEEIYSQIIAFAKKNDILILHDNAYSDIIFNDVIGRSFLSYEGAKEVGVEFFSLSKSFNMTGARVSFLVGRADVVGAFRKLRSQIDFGMFLPVQKAAVAALKGPLDMVKEQCHDYEARRDALCNGLRDLGWNVADSKGSMFVWAEIPDKNITSMDYCIKLMEEAGVICTPGASFGPAGEGYVRFALVLPPDKIKEAIESIRQNMN